VSALFGDSCFSATFCVAVGYSESSSGGPTAPLAEIWNGTAWAMQSVPVDPSVTSPALAGVSCTSATNCIVVGDSGGVVGAGPAIADQWNGSTWQPMTFPSPPAGTYTYDQLSNISCPSPASCVAAGLYVTPDGTTENVETEVWDGTTWRLQPGADPSGWNVPVDVWCVSATSCMIAGTYLLGTTQHQLTLAETWNGTSWQVPPVSSGYQIAVYGGGVKNFNTSWFGSQNGNLSGTVTGVAADPQTGGYWMLDSDGGVANFNAPWYGSQRGQLSGTKPAAIAADPLTGGYWVLDANGGVQSYGAPWHGSQRGHLTGSAVGIVADPKTGGYWILDANGAVSAYDAPWYGSERGHVSGSAIAITADPATDGYWILDAQGGVNGFNAPWYGSERGHLTAAPVALATDPATAGYWVLNARGGISGFNAPWYGSLANPGLSRPPAGLTGQ
jgi:hypothetical protein